MLRNDLVLIKFREWFSKIHPSFVPELLVVLTPGAPSTILDSAGSKSCAPSSVRLTCGCDATAESPSLSAGIFSEFLSNENTVISV